MNQWVWTNRYHPQTLQIFVVLAYFRAVMAILFSGINSLGLIGILIVILSIIPAFGVANSRWWGYIISVIFALIAVADLVIFAIRYPADAIPVLLLSESVFNTIFTIAILALLVHPMSFQYVKRNFVKRIP